MSGAQPSHGLVPAPAPPVGLPRLLAGAPLRTLAEHQGYWGAPPRPNWDLVAEIDRAGLRGRGGARFPAAVKMRAASPGRSGVVVANATEGEPASAKDKTLLRVATHLVLDGAFATAAATGAAEVIVAVDRGAQTSVQAAERAIAERRSAGVDGSISARVVGTPDRYLAGQETALVRWINGGSAKPTVAPPRPTDRAGGVGGRRTVVHNVETLAHVALIARYGADWYRQLGVAEDAGSTLVTVTGGVERPGVYEVAMGTPVSRLVSGAGGRPGALAGVLLGGYYGSWLPLDAIDVPLAAGPLAAVGASVGAGVVAVLPAGTCPLQEAARVTRWLAAQSAGQCGPCAHGLPAIAGALTAVATRPATYQRKGETAALRWAAMVEGRGACHLPDGTARFVRSTLAVFADHLAAHRRHGPCPPRPAVLSTPRPGPWR